MAGNRIGGLKAASTNKLNHGDDFYRRIGSIGGKSATKPKGFATMDHREVRENGRRGGLVRAAGLKGGRPKGSVGASKRYREDKFLIIDETIDSPVIEFEKKSAFKGWFRRRQS